MPNTEGFDDQHSQKEGTDPINAAYRDALLERYNNVNGNKENMTNDDDDDIQFYDKFKRSIHNKTSNFENLESSSDLDYTDDSDYTDRANQTFVVRNSDSESDNDEEEEEELDDEFLEDDSEEDANDCLIDDLLDTTTTLPDQTKTQRNSEYNSTDNENAIGSDDEELEDDSEYDIDIDNLLSTEPQFQWFRFILVVLVLTIFLPIVPVIFKFTNNFGKSIVRHSFYSQNSNIDMTGSFGTLQKQINHLYNELSVKDERQKVEFDEKVKIIISQFEKNIKKLMPKKLLSFEDEIEELNIKLNDLTNKYDLINTERVPNHIDNEKLEITRSELLKKLDLSLPNNIPIDTMNNASVKDINLQDFKKYVSNFLILLFDNIMETNSIITSENVTLEATINAYIEEITNEKLKMFDNTASINELKRNIEEMRVELWYEIKEYLSKVKNDVNLENSHSVNQISTSFLKTIILQIYNSNRYQWENDLDFATTVQGSSIIPSLTSPVNPKGNGLKPLALLLDSVYNSPSAYWECKISKDSPCKVAIKFNRPLHLTRIFYIHGRLINNLHIMNSAPRDISIYVLLQNDRDHSLFTKEARNQGQGVLHPNDRRFVKIGTFAYDLKSLKVRQQFQLPSWYINFKPLVKAVLFEVDNNHGNEQFVSLKKFIINGVIEEDLDIIKSGIFPLDFSNGNYIPEYASEEFNEPTEHRSLPSKDVASFGEDQPVN
ncbi:similar to Saccharomyces cerevisiae YJL019W MPS3 Nuclear envelope protein required for SPB duplication and nuclear fusion [Maudiozyma saulgeensis]|uniref:Similar to Saccharomyces cerevisiae YJL019W MPS3 Nuclear envelope protein required for SPB duplication and nuclear fusion n=1 Tax=Maudiozyma saulgeensis TaxID=1789683 RepID=A0A1X7QYF2_9SACH|nr:similar to Saccharomyces cerevisiae YJL019W MPS3 Nuclear envelope protein required for SPB duplication and nuclear fusion [Kazachstania saulgeensis]